MRRARIPALLLAGILMAGCGSDTADDRADDRADDPAESVVDDDTSEETSEAAATSAATTTEAPAESVPEAAEPESEPEPAEVTGTVVSADDDQPLAGVVVASGPNRAISDDDGRFTIELDPDHGLLARRPTWLPMTIDAADAEPDSGTGLTLLMEPVVARGVRVSRYVAADATMFGDLLDLVEGTAVNALVFDTKDETGMVLYETEVEAAARLGAVEPVYDPEQLVALALDQGLYPITRLVTFEDDLWADADAEAKLAGAWVDPSDRDNWDYPLDLAMEACQLGFAEVQFDYVRFPAGRTAEAALAAGLVPATADERTAVIAAFLAEAKQRLAPEGCGVSAAIFGIVMSSNTDEGIGQTVEAVGATVDAISPMLYPSHYGPGWLGFADPNDHPGPVIADALDDGMPRVPGRRDEVQVRPWIQAFYYNGAQIGAQISEAEARGAGWLLWNASGNYRADWLPAAP